MGLLRLEGDGAPERVDPFAESALVEVDIRQAGEREGPRGEPHRFERHALGLGDLAAPVERQRQMGVGVGEAQVQTQPLAQGVNGLRILLLLAEGGPQTDEAVERAGIEVYRLLEQALGRFVPHVFEEEPAQRRSVHGRTG